MDKLNEWNNWRKHNDTYIEYVNSTNSVLLFKVLSNNMVFNINISNDLYVSSNNNLSWINKANEYICTKYPSIYELLIYINGKVKCDKILNDIEIDIDEYINDEELILNYDRRVNITSYR